ncbi:MAG: FAD-dependent oxidoreductase [Planctomycetota bacterium]|jgi:glutamate synthase (NADPH/NADH) small chain
MAGEHRPFSAAEALAEAWRCLDCENAPCSQACPAGVDVRGFIRKIRFENFHGAARRIREANILGETCAYLCPVEVLCEGRCRTTEISHPVAIARLQAFACRFGRESGFEPSERPHPLRPPWADSPQKNPDVEIQKVACVGSGPASLACAAEVARIGYEAAVFEKESVIGGVPAFGIPEERIPGEILASEVDRIRELGVTFHTGTAFGRDFRFDSLYGDGFRAIFLGAGLTHCPASRIPAEEGVSPVPGLDFLKMCRLHEVPELAGRIAVIGGGNTAVDVACTALKAGAHEVFLLYRRSFQEMPAWPRERIRAMERGIQPFFLVQPKAYLDDPEGVTVELVRTELGEPDRSGRRRPVPVEGSEFRLKVGAVIEATGQEISPEVVGSLAGVQLKRGRIVVDPATFMTRRQGVFAAGDVVNGGATVAQAIGEARKAAVGIHKYLSK